MLIVNDKYKPKDLIGYVLFLDGLKMESRDSRVEVFRHPVDTKKQNLADDVHILPEKYSAQLFVADNPQGYIEQFKTWGRAFRGEKAEPFSVSVFNGLLRLRGVVVDIDEMHTGRIEQMMITGVSCSKDVRKGLNINIELEEIHFAESSLSEEYFSEDIDVKSKTAPATNKGKAGEKDTPASQNSSLAGRLSGKGENASGQVIQ
jgi:hypothetical protein